jgi:predicted ATPase
MAQALGLWETKDHPLAEQLQAFLKSQHPLLLLDNFEQVVPAAPQLSFLLSSCPRLHLLVTSRETLHLSSEYEVPVAPLAVPDLAQYPEQQTFGQVSWVRLFLE